MTATTYLFSGEHGCAKANARIGYSFIIPLHVPDLLNIQIPVLAERTSRKAFRDDQRSESGL